MPPRAGHSRVKALDYDDDDVYSDDDLDEGDGDGMTDEDKEQLRLGTINVKSALGPSLSIPDTEIQEALWHYYFDVAKAVSYLKNKLAPKPVAQTKKQKPISRFDQAAASTSGPSPDDIVMNAQAKGTKPKKGTSKPASGDKATNDVTNSVSALSVEEAPRVKSKNLDVLKEFEKSDMKRMANFVVIGHVDHGKSTLMGRLLYDLKVIDQRSVDKLRKEAETIGKSSFALAWVMDQTSEERSRGVTVDIATNFFETEKTKFTILDAPGHQDFIPNMIAGASQADFAVLVIDAGINSFESGLKGQTKEHAMLVRSMGVQRLVVAVNKMDTVQWSKERFDEISQQMTAFLVSASFAAKNLTFIPCAGLTGGNIIRPPPAKTFPDEWYTGPTLIEALDASEPAKRALTLPLRLTVSDVFRGGIMHPLSISGRLDAGSCQVGDTVLAMPAGEAATIKGIESESESVDWAVAGQIVTLHLADIDPVHLRLGDIICTPNNPIQNIKRFTAKILAFEDVFPMSVDVFRGRMNAPAKVVRLVSTLNKASGAVEKKKPRIVAPGALAKVVVELEREMPLEVGTRVVLRAGGDTVAAGLLESVE
ncbi:elongation factor 1 alpha [Lophium mytilinum]|uniref:Elongation factor 1 alpha-like protein n=1 Tax=Lophium mytilinum TaxID=390894 RepID=A0A6A6QQU5_9PEZI|nr:elongation factor 1 alpha [Lophium mytilinum]